MVGMLVWACCFILLPRVVTAEDAKGAFDCPSQETFRELGKLFSLLQAPPNHTEEWKTFQENSIVPLVSACLASRVYYPPPLGSNKAADRAGLRGGGGVGMGVSGMVFVGLVLGCIEAKFCK